LKNLTFALCILAIGCFSTNDSRKSSSKKPADILGLADGGQRSVDSSLPDAGFAVPEPTKDASPNSEVVELDASVTDSEVFDANESPDAGIDASYPDGGEPGELLSCQVCSTDVDCADLYECGFWLDAKYCFKIAAAFNDCETPPGEKADGLDHPVGVMDLTLCYPVKPITNYPDFCKNWLAGQ
jgi:hypothetical protein